MVINFLDYFETKAADLAQAEAAQKAENNRRVNLEWVLADLIADIQAA